MKYLISIVLTITVILTIGRDLLPFQNSMFTSHDSSQPARIVEFVYNIQHLQLPPRIAPHWSFGLGFPVFNFYAPTAYWITSLINIIGLSVIDSLKLSYLLSMVLASIGMYLFLKNFFKPMPSVCLIHHR